MAYPLVALLLVLTAAPGPDSDAKPDADPASPQVDIPETGAAPDETNPEESGLDVNAKRDESDAFGDSGGTGKDVFSFRTLTQVRYENSWVDPNQLSVHKANANFAGDDLNESGTVKRNDGYLVNRMFLRVVGKVPAHKITGKLLLDFAALVKSNPGRLLKLAYVETAPFKRLTITAGLFKRTFSLLELLPIASFELGDVGPTDDYMKNQGYGGRDVGAMMALTPLNSNSKKKKQQWLTLYLGAFSGDTQEGFDASPGKLITGRMETELVRGHLVLGLDGAWRPGQSLNETSSKATCGTLPLTTKPEPDPYCLAVAFSSGAAYSGDVTVTAGGFQLRAEAMTGRNAALDYTYTNLGVTTRDTTFAAAWALAAYRFAVGRLGVMPVGRVEWLDANRQDATTGSRLYLTAGLNFMFTDHLRLLFDLSHYSVQDRTNSIYSIPWQTSNSVRNAKDVNFTQLIVQLQLVL